MSRFLLMTAVLMVGAIACTRPDPLPTTTLVSGTITVDNADAQADFSGIQVRVFTQVGLGIDTLFSAETDLDGRFSGIARIPATGLYELAVFRNGRLLHVSDVVLAPYDTVTISGTIPRLAETFRVESPQNLAWATYKRLDRQFERLMVLAQTGLLTADSTLALMVQWSDLFWSMNDKHPTTFAAQAASVQAVQLLNGVDDTRMMDRLAALPDDSIGLEAELVFGGDYHFRTTGLDKALAYVDSVRRAADLPLADRRAGRRRIELLIAEGDAARATDETRAYRAAQHQPAEQAWAENLLYELENLIPGKPMPAFTIPMITDSISTETLRGTTYLIEFVSLRDRDYQQNHPRLVRLHQRARAAGMVFITVPIDLEMAVYDGFFTERPLTWPVAPPGAFDRSGIGRTLRVDRVPTRFLVGRDGIILDRYLTTDLDELVADLDLLIQAPNP